jgi:predicted dithiol-disulfide oxidoreductase (DUF899 family)
MKIPGESDEYRRARDELLRAEIELRRQEEAVAAKRRELPPGGEPPEDYVFEGQGGPVRLSELFEDGKDTLFLYSFMFIPGEQGLPLEGPCPSCTSIIDALDGEIPHIVQRVNVAVSAKAPLEQFQAHAQRRGWRNARLLSSAGSTYNVDYGAEAPDGSQLPIAAVFTRRDGRLRHFWSSELFDAPTDPGQHPRHVDFMWPVWKVLDLTPEGRGTDFHPKLEY